VNLEGNGTPRRSAAEPTKQMQVALRNGRIYNVEEKRQQNTIDHGIYNAEHR
jgi:hypothetical protein